MLGCLSHGAFAMRCIAVAPCLRLPAKTAQFRSGLSSSSMAQCARLNGTLDYTNKFAPSSVRVTLRTLTVPLRSGFVRRATCGQRARHSCTNVCASKLAPTLAHAMLRPRCGHASLWILRRSTLSNAGLTKPWRLGDALHHCGTLP